MLLRCYLSAWLIVFELLQRFKNIPSIVVISVDMQDLLAFDTQNTALISFPIADEV
jgi:hypothetical protein